MKTILVLAMFLCAFFAHAADTAAISVYFSPTGGCSAAVVKELNGAKSNVLIQAYSFTSKDIARAVVDAHKRGVDVRIILDKSNETDMYSAASFVAHAGLPTLIDARHAIAHNKVMVIDDQTVITGSFNFTTAAEEDNAENLLILHNRKLAQKYIANWHTHAAHSPPYKPPTD